jgi:hypothetical protein
MISLDSPSQLSSDHQASPQAPAYPTVEAKDINGAVLKIQYENTLDDAQPAIAFPLYETVDLGFVGEMRLAPCTCLGI